MWNYTWGWALYVIGIEGLKALAPFALAGMAVWVAYAFSSHSRMMRG